MKKKGSITVEAALVIPIFALAMLTLAFVMRLVYVDETMKNSLSHTANNISQYAYLYKKTGLQGVVNSGNNAMEHSAIGAEKQKEVVLKGLSEFNKIQTQENVDLGDISQINSSASNINDFASLVTTVRENPGKEAIMLLCAVGNAFKGNVSSFIYEGISKYLFLMDIGNDSESYEEKLNKMNLVDAGGNKVDPKDALNFEGTTFNNGSDIIIELQYNVKIPFPLISKKVFPMKAKAHVKGWDASGPAGEAGGE